MKRQAIAEAAICPKRAVKNLIQCEEEQGLCLILSFPRVELTPEKVPDEDEGGPSLKARPERGGVREFRRRR